jgi:multidrug efflux system membrane fusion protein
MLRLPYAGQLNPFFDWRRPAITAVAAIAATILSSCSQQKAPQAAMPDPRSIPAVPVRVATAVRKTVPVEVRVIGNVEPSSTVTVRSQVEGVINKICFKEGQDVSVGNVLFTLDSRALEAKLAQAEATLAHDEAQAQNAEAQANRYTQLFKAGIVSKDQYEQYTYASNAIAASVKADKAAIEEDKVQLGYSTIRAPQSGRTGALLVHLGDAVKANDTGLVVINQISPAYVDFSVPERYLPDIKRFQGHRELPVKATIPQEEQDPETGALSFVNNTVDTNTGTILLKGTFANSRRRLWPGQFLNVTLVLSSHPNATVVPTQAVTTGQTGQFVFVVKPNQTVESRAVTTAGTYGGDTIIEKGVQAGETVVTDGQLRLFPGAKIEARAS